MCKNIKLFFFCNIYHGFLTATVKNSLMNNKLVSQ